MHIYYSVAIVHYIIDIFKYHWVFTACILVYIFPGGVYNINIISLKGEIVMINETNFIVRISGRRENSCYIDYQGVYKITEIAKIIGVEAPKIKEIYLKNNGDYDESQDVYYFGSIDSAKAAISQILKCAKSDMRGRLVFLTEAELEYIRKALINENSNTIRVSNSVKDAIFKKLNS